MTQKPVFMEEIFTLRNLRSMGAAAVVEMLLASGIAAILIWQHMRPVPQPASIVDSTPVLTPQLPRQPPQHVRVPEPQRPQVQPFSEVPFIPTPLPTPITEPVQPPQAPVQPQASPAVLNEFASLMLRAINEQKLYPKGPMLKGETGQTVVSFDYVDGVVSNIRVDQSSGTQELDDAAVAAVQKAALPPKPPELANLTRFVFTLAFHIGD